LTATYVELVQIPQGACSLSPSVAEWSEQRDESAKERSPGSPSGDGAHQHHRPGRDSLGIPLVMALPLL